jgi:Mce-associated membrane protein
VRSRTGKLLVALLVLVWLGTSAFAFFQYRDLKQLQDRVTASSQATKAAKKAMTSMVTYDYRTVDDDFKWVESAGTKGFQEYFRDASSKSKKLIVELQATATGTVIDAAPKLGTKTKVQVLLFVDQLIKSKDDPEGKLDQTRVAMWMVKQGDRWLVSKVLLRDRPTTASMVSE